MHPIPVRRMRLQVPAAESFHPLFAANDAMLSYSLTGLGLYVALLEPFIVKSMRRVLDKITDPALKEEVDRFCRQEAQHYQQHERFNEVILAQGYPGLEQRMQRLKDDFDLYLRDRDDRFRIGFLEGFEANTTQGALALLKSHALDHPRSEKSFAALFKWHLLEEVEHRNVAYDVYQHLVGDRLYRSRMCWVAQHHMAVFIDDCIKLMVPLNVERHGEKCRPSLRDRLLLLVSRVVPRAVSMWPWYSPHRYQLPPNVAQLSATLSAEAESVA